MHSFKVDTFASRTLLVKVNKGVKTSDNLTLGSDYSQIVQIPDNPKKLS